MVISCSALANAQRRFRPRRNRSDDTLLLSGALSGRGVWRMIFRPSQPDRVLFVGHKSSQYDQTLFWATRVRPPPVP